MRRRPTLTHRAVADLLVKSGFTARLPHKNFGLALLIDRAAELGGVLIGQVPAATADDFDEIRFEHRLLTEACEADPVCAIHAGAH